MCSIAFNPLLRTKSFLGSCEHPCLCVTGQIKGMQALYDYIVKLTQNAEVGDQKYPFLDSPVAICFMVELGFHSAAAYYVHRMPDRKVLGMKILRNPRD